MIRASLTGDALFVELGGLWLSRKALRFSDLRALIIAIYDLN